MAFPQHVRQIVRSFKHGRAIRRGSFGDSNDPLFGHLAEWVSPGDLVIDVGAAVGTFSIRLSELVGPQGRVLALEPMPEQFTVLVLNTRWARFRNISCLQMAVSDEAALVKMTAPVSRGMPNWYQSQIGENGDTCVLCTPLDDLPLPGRVSFLKVDAEGHDFAVLRSGANIIERDRPVIFIEADDTLIAEWLRDRGYGPPREHPASPNRVYVAETHGSAVPVIAP